MPWRGSVIAKIIIRTCWSATTAARCRTTRTPPPASRKTTSSAPPAATRCMRSVRCRARHDRAVKARVIAAHGRHYVVCSDTRAPLLATRRGKRADVAIGDEVELAHASTGQPVIESILPRHSLLMRADEWREKMLAANIDQVAIVFAPQP